MRVDRVSVEQAGLDKNNPGDVAYVEGMNDAAQGIEGNPYSADDLRHTEWQEGANYFNEHAKGGS